MSEYHIAKEEFQIALDRFIKAMQADDIFDKDAIKDEVENIVCDALTEL